MDKREALGVMVLSLFMASLGVISTYQLAYDDGYERGVHDGRMDFFDTIPEIEVSSVYAQLNRSMYEKYWEWKELSAPMIEHDEDYGYFVSAIDVDASCDAANFTLRLKVRVTQMYPENITGADILFSGSYSAFNESEYFADPSTSIPYYFHYDSGNSEYVHVVVGIVGWFNATYYNWVYSNFGYWQSRMLDVECFVTRVWAVQTNWDNTSLYIFDKDTIKINETIASYFETARVLANTPLDNHWSQWRKGRPLHFKNSYLSSYLSSYFISLSLSLSPISYLGELALMEVSG
jgi:hypothetical protein